MTVIYHFCRNQCMKAAPRRNIIDVGRERWKDGGGLGSDVLLVPGDVSCQGHGHQDADPRAGPGAVPGLLGAEGSGSGGEPVLQQVPGQDPEAAQVSGPSQTPSEKSVILKVICFSTRVNTI